MLLPRLLALFSCLLTPVLAVQEPAAGPGSEGRVRAGLQVEYRFDEGTGIKVHDRSGLQPALDLSIENSAAARWISGGLTLHAPTMLSTPGPALRLTEALRKSQALTIEAWIRPAARRQAGMARLIGVSGGDTLRNFTLGQGEYQDQPSNVFQARARSTETDLNGLPGLVTAEGAVTGAIQHVVFTRDRDGATSLYVDGEVQAESTLAGTFDNWDSGYQLLVANEAGAKSPWLGDLYLLAIYDRALAREEIGRNFAAQSGASNLGHLSVAPLASASVIAVQGQGLVHSDRGWVLSNIGNRPLEWSAQEDCAWLELAPASGTLAPGAQVTLNLSVIESALAELPLGNHSAEIRFDNAGSNLGNAVREVILQHLAPGTGDGRGVKPGPHNTGPSDPSALKKVGSITVTKKGTVLENVHIEGALIIRADDVVVRNFVIDGGGTAYGIRCSFGNTGLRFENGEIYNVASACVYGAGFTARALNLHESGSDGFKTASGSIVEGCWIHHMGMAPGAHADGNQTRDGKGLVFRGNFFDMPIDIGAPYKSNAALIIQTGLGPIDDVLIEGNWLNGGNFTLYVTDKGTGYGPPTNVRIKDNWFGRDYRYGVLDSFGYQRIEGNRWEDTGELMSINNQ